MAAVRLLTPEHPLLVLICNHKAKLVLYMPGVCRWFMSDLQSAQPASPDANREESQPLPAPQGGMPEVLASIDALLAELEASQQAFAQQLHQALQARDEHAARVKTLEFELAALLVELDFEQRIKKVEEEARQVETDYDFKLKT